MPAGAGPLLALVQGKAAEALAAAPQPKLGRRETRLVTSWAWLKLYGKTPADLGLPWERVDPCWRTAMLTISNAYEDERKRREAPERPEGWTR